MRKCTSIAGKFIDEKTKIGKSFGTVSLLRYNKNENLVAGYFYNGFKWKSKPGEKSIKNIFI